MSLKTLLERFTRGLPLPSASGYGEAQYYGDDEDYMTNPATLDYAEKEELIRNNKTKLYELEEKLKQEHADAEQKRKEEETARIEQEVKTRLSQVGTTQASVQ